MVKVAYLGEGSTSITYQLFIVIGRVALESTDRAFKWG